MLSWILTFETRTVRKVGGLAEVPPSLARYISKYGWKSILVTPSHGQRVDGGVELEAVVEGSKYVVYTAELEGVKHYIVDGGVFSDPDVYGGNLGFKAIVFAKIVRELFEKAVYEGTAPDVVHANDWHSGISLIALNSLSLKLGVGVSLVYHIHLLSRTWFSRSDLESVLAGSVVRGVYGLKPFAYYYDISSGFVDRLVPLVSDKTITVSLDYAKTVERFVGLAHGIRVGVVENASTWSFDEVVKLSSILVGSPGEPSRRLVREKLLKTLCKERVSSLDASSIETLRRLGLDVEKDLWHQCFEEDGDLVLFTGRVSKQKGIDVLLASLEKAVARNPDLRILLMVIPVPGSEKILEKIVYHLGVFKRNLKAVFGHVDKRIYLPAHYASRAYIAPSLYEPFGLVALEAMASGTPVVASNTGGFKTTVLDARVYGVKGTGVLVEPGSVDELASYMSDTAYLMRLEEVEEDRVARMIAESITDPALRKIAGLGSKAPLSLRGSCVDRSKGFTWDKSALKLSLVYKPGGTGVLNV
ncbi:glycosyltransferase [Thermogladius sp. 4427co]|uniref:glycosyltransferase n=1 Tax=Thermogladius sp. 4427co TaxID=3450718 RepID=UPI003F7A3A5F